MAVVAALAILLLAFFHVAPRRIGGHARRVDEIATAKPVLDLVAKGSEPVDGARSMTELPAAARHYVEMVEKRRRACRSTSSRSARIATRTPCGTTRSHDAAALRTRGLRGRPAAEKFLAGGGAGGCGVPAGTRPALVRR
ncbi:hypothetical protein predicted by Glimmer/Critica [Sorangium cellulosum So ce56]|uniref:Uncharacterized protein n=1 Tax=Sorangium cellulosum (strain So ce56) TaxID=448385 RepID=A9FQL2_SORC5|nr:hypothetical protein predicted by Glimmer/Critica [Sorangium cellulosum So ce56]